MGPQVIVLGVGWWSLCQVGGQGERPTGHLELGFRSQARGDAHSGQETPCGWKTLPGPGLGAAHTGPVLGDHSTKREPSPPSNPTESGEAAEGGE